MTDLITESMKKFFENEQMRINQFAAAYLKLTDIPADQAVMFVQNLNIDGIFTQKIWFERKGETDAQQG